MSSVTGRIKQVTQPRGGYLKPKDFEAVSFDDGLTLHTSENLHPVMIGLVVDGLTRVMTGTSARQAFDIAFKGATVAENAYGVEGALETARKLLSNGRIKGLDAASIINACKVATFDVWYRNPMAARYSPGVDDTLPDPNTIENIRLMVERTLRFWGEYGPVVMDGFTFAPYGYTETVDTGDGDYLTSNGLWDMKVSKAKPTSKHTLQLLMYWRMGLKSGQDVFQSIETIGVFNPRLNMAWVLDVKSIPDSVIETVERDVIGY